MSNRIAMWGLLLLLLSCVAGGAVLLGNITGALDLYRAQMATRQAEADAAKLQAQLDLAQAQAQIESARGERAVLEAAARSVDADRRLVTWYTLRGDLRGALAFIGALGLAICGGVLYVILRRERDAKAKD